MMINYQLEYLVDLARMNAFQPLLPRLFFGLYFVTWNQHDQLPKRRSREENHVLIPVLQISLIVKTDSKREEIKPEFVLEKWLKT